MSGAPFLTGFTVIFWGWQTGMLAVSLVIAALFELPRYISHHIDITKEHLAKLWKLSNIIFMAAAVIAFMRFKSAESFFLLTQWLPLIFLPIVLPLAYKIGGKVDLEIFFVFFEKVSLFKNRSVSLFYPYLMLCIASASTANVRGPGFYAGLIIISSMALFPFRSKRFTPAFWLFLLLLAGASGYVGGVGLNRLQGIVENAFIDWYVGSGRQDFDASRTRTAIGDIGELKLSNRIIMRVSGNSPRAIDYRLGKTTYNSYKSSTWRADEAPLLPLPMPRNNKEWDLTPAVSEKAATKSLVKIWAPSNEGEGLLAIPGRAMTLVGLPSSEISRSRFGTFSVKDGPPVFDYHIVLGSSASMGSPPDKKDLIIPEEEKTALSQIAAKLGLKSKSPGEIIAAVDSFFKGAFEYSLNLGGGKTNSTHLSDFLLRTRTGHCEYFATAATLLLRQAGIPARYTVGYVYDEFSELEDMFIVRERNAHAWAIAYVDGEWIVVDTTPSSWQSVDKEHAPFWEPLSDTWSAISFLFSKWQREGGSIINNRYSMAAILLLVIILLGKVWKGRGLIKEEAKKEEIPRHPSPGEGSPFYLIEKALSSQGGARQDGETYLHWLKRLEREGALPFPTDSMQTLLTLHMRWRFDPQGISDIEKSELESEVALLLEKQE